jgi:hypothetical protein
MNEAPHITAQHGMQPTARMDRGALRLMPDVGRREDCPSGPNGG